MERYADIEFIMKPKVDFCFKELMEDAEVRRGFTAAVLHIPPEEIAETVLLPTSLRKKYEGDKLGILDVRVLLNNSTQIDIEIQVSPFPLWPERSLFYLAKMFTDQIEKGEGYERLEKCVHVGILDFILFGEDEEYYSCFHIREDLRNRLYTDKREVHILELPKLKKNDYPETELLNWAKFMNAERQEEFEEMAEKDKYIEKAYEALKNISADDEKRLEYEAREKALRDHNYLMKSNWEAGEKIGISKGMEQGESRVNRLVQMLIANSRTEEIEKAVSDREYQQALFREFHL
ncbi:Rpn family recombination-promoting nuclease/putative transposase [Blautia producta]|uniref:Rpn family recombination-promoting nuclease/putative transposase n=2 Tax=Blautia producta TaxID=33035 RepID=UPI0031B5BD30